MSQLRRRPSPGTFPFLSLCFDLDIPEQPANNISLQNRAGMPIPLNNPPAPTVPLVVYQPASQPPANVVVVNNPGQQQCAPEQPMCQQAQQCIVSQGQQQYLGSPVYQQPATPGPDVPQPFAPADPDPNRVYWFRKHGGQYVTLTRYAIDQMNVVWYCKTDGSWYAVHV